MYSYQAYGLRIASPVEIPELVVADGEPDVEIRFGPVAPLDPDARNPYIHAVNGRVYVDVEDVGRFLVDSGRAVTIDTVTGVDERAVRVFLLGLIMGILLDHNGFMTFHASAVTVADACVAFVGYSGAGKSTTAAAFHAAGHPMMTDDILALRPEGDGLIAVPGFPRLQLNPDSASFLGHSPETDEATHPALCKHVQRIGDGFADKAAPLRRIYVLQPSDGMEIVPLSRTDGLKELLTHWNGSKFGMDMILALGPETHLRHCVAVSRQVSVRRLCKTREFSDLPALVRMVEEDVAES